MNSTFLQAHRFPYRCETLRQVATELKKHYFIVKADDASDENPYSLIIGFLSEEDIRTMWRAVAKRDEDGWGSGGRKGARYQRSDHVRARDLHPYGESSTTPHSMPPVTQGLSPLEEINPLRPMVDDFSTSRVIPGTFNPALGTFQPSFHPGLPQSAFRYTSRFGRYPLHEQTYPDSSFFSMPVQRPPGSTDGTPSSYCTVFDGSQFTQYQHSMSQSHQIPPHASSQMRSINPRVSSFTVDSMVQSHPSASSSDRPHHHPTPFFESPIDIEPHGSYSQHDHRHNQPSSQYDRASDSSQGFDLHPEQEYSRYHHSSYPYYPHMSESSSTGHIIASGYHQYSRKEMERFRGQGSETSAHISTAPPSIQPLIPLRHPHHHHSYPLLQETQSLPAGYSRKEMERFRGQGSETSAHISTAPPSIQPLIPLRHPHHHHSYPLLQETQSLPAGVPQYGYSSGFDQRLFQTTERKSQEYTHSHDLLRSSSSSSSTHHKSQPGPSRVTPPRESHSSEHSDIQARLPPFEFHSSSHSSHGTSSSTSSQGSVGPYSIQENTAIPILSRVAHVLKEEDEQHQHQRQQQSITSSDSSYSSLFSTARSSTSYQSDHRSGRISTIAPSSAEVSARSGQQQPPDQHDRLPMISTIFPLDPSDDLAIEDIHADLCSITVPSSHPEEGAKNISINRSGMERRGDGDGVDK
ncbi:hypothetical protein ADUPG1_006606 [Aduncisulcus paluster]|uniref:Uncharacterized protein n=1 Tax=Aduncisulcus paluster TaxID=2918883 RepID=A0ABQ5KKH5_9EUKA|nr:hypothetical protein ADUPG1_006606 [Aduncisulcus paluster]